MPGARAARRPLAHRELAQHAFARIGIAKSFQITNVFKQLSAHENVRVALQMQATRFQLLKPRSSYRALIERADALLERVGLQHCRDRVGRRILVDGNSAAALGCVYGGATVAAWYPITPSSSLPETLTTVPLPAVA